MLVLLIVSFIELQFIYSEHVIILTWLTFPSMVGSPDIRCRSSFPKLSTRRAKETKPIITHIIHTGISENFLFFILRVVRPPLVRSYCFCCCIEDIFYEENVGSDVCTNQAPFYRSAHMPTCSRSSTFPSASTPPRTRTGQDGNGTFGVASSPLAVCRLCL